MTRQIYSYLSSPITIDCFNINLYHVFCDNNNCNNHVYYLIYITNKIQQYEDSDIKEQPVEKND